MRCDSYLSIEKEKQLYNGSKGVLDPAILGNAVGKLYGRILELADEILSLRELRAELLHEQDLMTKHCDQQEAKIVDFARSLASEKDARVTAEIRVAELADTARHLTEWNGSLEEQNKTLMAALQQHHCTTQQSRISLEDDLLVAIKRQIQLRRELDLMEEENGSLRATLREALDIQQRVRQESAILKSKLYDWTLRGEGTIGDSPLTMSPEHPKRYTTIEKMQLNESYESTRDILGILKLQSTRKLFK
jgi:chromosome segregation ATPase